MYKYCCFLLLTFCFFSTSCRRNSNLQDSGTDFLQGVWAEDSVAYQNQLLQYTSHTFKFSCDSFYATLNTFAKVNAFADSCFNKGRFTEYAKGVYTLNNDTLLINGTFTKSNFKQKISGCYRSGQYLKSFIIKRKLADTIYLQSMQQHTPLILNLKQAITCVRKPIN